MLLTPSQSKLATKLSVKAIMADTTSQHDTDIEILTNPKQDIKRFKYIDSIVNKPNQDKNRELI